MPAQLVKLWSRMDDFEKAVILTFNFTGVDPSVKVGKEKKSSMAAQALLIQELAKEAMQHGG